MTVGLLNAITSAIGESDAEIGGLYKTRLTSALQTGTALVAAYTWDGTLVITTADTSAVVVGEWIRLDSDGQYFEIDSIVTNTSVTVLNPNSFTVPGTVGSPLSTQSSKAITTLPVETTLRWDSSGKVSVDGIVYYYTATTNTSFTGITHVSGGISRPGIFKAHRIEASVVDLNRSRNALDLARRMMLVDYSEEEFLDAIGQNHGVSRTPYLAGDDTTFRKVIKALSYNPRGTIYGMELLLDALVGAGNYEIIEDLISYPCTVFIRFLGSASTASVSTGKAFLNGVESQHATGSKSVSISMTPLAVGGVRLTDESFITETKTAKPQGYPASIILMGYKDGVDPYSVKSFDGITWAEIAAGTRNETIYGMGASADGIVCAVGPNQLVLRSDDLGASWTEPANPGTWPGHGMTYSPTAEKWIAVGDREGGGGGWGYIGWSEDGNAPWTRIAGLANQDFKAVHAANGVIIAVGGGLAGLTAMVYRSTDALTWVPITVPNVGQCSLRGVTYDAVNNKWIAVGDATVVGGNDSTIFTSDDNGLTWAHIAPGSTKFVTLWAVHTNAAGETVAVGSDDGATDMLLYHSTDGIAFAEIATPVNVQGKGVTFNEDMGLWIVCGLQDGDALIMTSPNGLAPWTRRVAGKNFPLYCAASIAGSEWYFIGTDEATQVTLHPITTDSGCIEFTTAVDNSNAHYRRNIRIRPESDAIFELVATIPVGVNPHVAEANQAALAIYDMERAIGAGCIQIDANNFGVGLSNPIAGTLLVGSAVTLAKGEYHTIAIKKSGTNDVELHVNGIIVETATHASFPASALNKVEFGILEDPPTNNPFFRVRQAAVSTNTVTDYWNARGTAGQVAGANPERLTDAAFNDFESGDVGNGVIITGSGVTNGKGGNNNGRFEIDSFVGATAVELVGADQAKADISADLVTVTVPLTGYQFQYPDDLGKKIVVSGSALANDGEYVIDSLLSQAAGNPDLASGLSPVPERTNICKVDAGTPFASAEVDLDWNLKPVFINEGPGLSWEMSDAGSFSGSALTLRQAVPVPDIAGALFLDVLFSNVLSAQVLLDASVANLLDAYYPFYLADPLGFIRAYMDDITAAGVIPDFEYV